MYISYVSLALNRCLVSETLPYILACIWISSYEPGELVSVFNSFFVQNSCFILEIFQVKNDLLNLVFLPPVLRLSELFRYGSGWVFSSHTFALCTELCVLSVAIV